MVDLLGALLPLLHFPLELLESQAGLSVEVGSPALLHLP